MPIPVDRIRAAMPTNAAALQQSPTANARWQRLGPLFVLAMVMAQTSCGVDVQAGGDGNTTRATDSADSNDGSATAGAADPTAVDPTVDKPWCEISGERRCINDDGCCPAGCAALTDSDCPTHSADGSTCSALEDADCSRDCGDGVVDPSQGELCDGNCPRDPQNDCPSAPAGILPTCESQNAASAAQIIGTGDQFVPEQCVVPSILGNAEQCTAECGYCEITACISDDGCCPPGCHERNDEDCLPQCGNGIVEGVETCDGNCPESCDDGDPCTSDRLTGDADTCSAQCVSDPPISACSLESDGCCPVDCRLSNDVDCVDICDDGFIEGTESCDPRATCPLGIEDCGEAEACTTLELIGDPFFCRSRCVESTITACADDDGCCPSGCNQNPDTADNDCISICGNALVDPGELCEPSLDCPSDCNDDDACTTDTYLGSPESCDARCLNTAISNCIDGDGCCPPACHAENDADCDAVCGNLILEAGETCDPPSSCPIVVFQCEDGDACTTHTLQGNAASCSAECIETLITSCVSGDGCCPLGCNSTPDSQDTDCDGVCGNGILEGLETCDPPGSCPTSCDDADACTVDILVGDADNCNAVCAYADVELCLDGDACCPDGCNANIDGDCDSVCGNGAIEAGETCDPPASCESDCDDGDVCATDTRSGSNATCNVECSNETIELCDDGSDGCCPTGCSVTLHGDSDCVPVCGDGILDPGELCDAPDGVCPTQADCDAAAADCVLSTLEGSAETCDLRCVESPDPDCSVGVSSSESGDEDSSEDESSTGDPT